MNKEAADQEELLHFLDYSSLFRMKLITEILGNINGKTVVDIGSGTGSMSFCFWSLGAKVHSVDISFRALQVTRSLRTLIKRSIQFETSLCQADAMKLPFKGETFEIVCCLETLGLLPDDRTAIEEIARVTRRGGTVIVAVPYNAQVTGKEKMTNHHRQYSFETLRERLFTKQLCLERAIFWRFPMLDLLDRIRVRNVFATLGFLIETLNRKNRPSQKLENRRKQDAFVHSLVTFYRIKFWRNLEPLLMRLLALNMLFQNSPYSNDVFIVFKKVDRSKED
jgi:ubiquinone/menaquinone biosynthesis C-methylase UbiE